MFEQKINPNLKILKTIKEEDEKIERRIMNRFLLLREVNLCPGLYYKRYPATDALGINGCTIAEKCRHLNLENFICELDLNKKKCMSKNWFTKLYFNCEYRKMESSEEFKEYIYELI